MLLTGLSAMLGAPQTLQQAEAMLQGCSSRQECSPILLKVNTYTRRARRICGRQMLVRQIRVGQIGASKVRGSTLRGRQIRARQIGARHIKAR